MSLRLRFLTGFCVGVFLWLPIGLLICQQVTMSERGVPGLLGTPLDSILIGQNYMPLVTGGVAALCFRTRAKHWSEDAANRAFYSALLIALFVVGCLTHINGVWYLEFPARMRLSSLVYGVDID